MAQSKSTIICTAAFTAKNDNNVRQADSKADEPRVFGFLECAAVSEMVSSYKLVTPMEILSVTNSTN